MPLAPGVDGAALLLAALVGGLLGAAGLAAWRHGQRPAPPEPPPPAPADAAEPGPAVPPPPPPPSPRQEGRRTFLLNETGNVLISSSLPADTQLPDATLALFTQALAHLSTLFFAIAGTKDASGEACSLYNYAVLRRAMSLHPVFIPVATARPEPRAPGPRRHITTLLALGETPPHSRAQWLDGRVDRSRQVLGLQPGDEGTDKLRGIHAQMRAEAERLSRQQLDRRRREGAGLSLWKAPMQLPMQQHGQPADQPSDQPSDADPAAEAPSDELEVGHVTLVCECLMGVSLVSVKLAHAHYHDYLGSDASDMAEDTYLFVSPSQLRSTLGDVRNLPHASTLPTAR